MTYDKYGPYKDDFAFDAIDDIKRRIAGRIADDFHNVNYLAEAVARAGNGDHLEIGTLFGGSAILAALVKRHYGLSGDIYAVDPLDGYYMVTPFARNVDPVSGLPVTFNTVLKNAKLFGVDDRIHIIPKRSFPVPVELYGKRFVSAFIDGNHWGDGPTLDWDYVSLVTSGYVVFDNHDNTHPAVMDACRIAENTPGWKVDLVAGITFIVRRV